MQASHNLINSLQDLKDQSVVLEEQDLLVVLVVLAQMDLLEDSDLLVVSVVLAQTDLLVVSEESVELAQTDPTVHSVLSAMLLAIKLISSLLLVVTIPQFLECMELIILLIPPSLKRRSIANINNGLDTTPMSKLVVKYSTFVH